MGSQKIHFRAAQPCIRLDKNRLQKSHSGRIIIRLHQYLRVIFSAASLPIIFKFKHQQVKNICHWIWRKCFVVAPDTFSLSATFKSCGAKRYWPVTSLWLSLQWQAIYMQPVQLQFTTCKICSTCTAHKNLLTWYWCVSKSDWIWTLP